MFLIFYHLSIRPLSAPKLRKALTIVNIGNCECLNRITNKWSRSTTPEPSSEELGRRRAARLCISGGIAALLSGLRNDSNNTFSLVNALRGSLLVEVQPTEEAMCKCELRDPSNIFHGSSFSFIWVDRWFIIF